MPCWQLGFFPDFSNFLANVPKKISGFVLFRFFSTWSLSNCSITCSEHSFVQNGESRILSASNIYIYISSILLTLERIQCGFNNDKAKCNFFLLQFWGNRGLQYLYIPLRVSWVQPTKTNKNKYLNKLENYLKSLMLGAFEKWLIKIT